MKNLCTRKNVHYNVGQCMLKTWFDVSACAPACVNSERERESV